MRLSILIIITFFSAILTLAHAANFNLDTGFAADASKYNKTLINAVSKAGTRLIGVGIHGIIIYSDDLGANWEQATVPTTKTLTDIDCIDKNICWATGHDAYILKTIDRGQNWSIQYQDEIFDAPLLSISMFNKNAGIAVGAFAKSLMTTDGGNTWNEFFVTEDEFQPHLNNVLVNGNNAYVAGELGLFYHSSDQGLSWSIFETGYAGSLWSSLLVSTNELILIGMSGNIITASSIENNEFEFKNYNNGVKNTLTNAVILSDGKIAISGLGGVVSVVDFNGNKDISTCIRQDRLGNNAIVEGENGNLLIIGQKGARLHNMQECYASSMHSSSVNTWISSKIN
jgi:photosystem II stability/assembly factor-like uncharacterized protein